MRRQKFLWFQLAALAGAGLAVLLVLETLLTYRYSATRLARAEGLVQAVEEVSALEHRLSREQVDTRNGLEQILRQTVDDRSEEIAWVSVIDASGQVQVSSSPATPARVFATDRIHAALERGENPSLVQNIAQGQILIALVPLMGQLLPRSGSKLPADWRLVEIAIYLRAPQGILHPLHRNLLVTALASFVLLAAMLVFLVRLKAYVRGRMLEDQLELARTVQQQLLPGPTEADALEFAGQCVPADVVGGDFYDVFLTERGEIALVLADVSGKGLPAALRMGVVHGAIRGLSRARKEESVGEMAGSLNELLRQESAHQFVTLFWGFYNPTTHEFVYVNAGHLPPLLVGSGSEEVRRLEAGGPVLGLLPGALYQEESVRLDGEETLVAFSDGLIEATGPGGEEFGESGVLSGIRASSGQPAAQVLRQIMDRAVTFVENGEFHDDLTVFVAKLAQNPKSGRGSQQNNSKND
ncbi:MAG TPA: SpoIIE family protein phosphatase [Candidatus Sulfotelmatobacter sp.]|nr:SpoIIE family protein phosphatase [Candidatus Sulfotelmatobacter sp.]